MVRVEFRRARDGGWRGFIASGHAGHAPEGQDIVCAAVTALAETSVLGLSGVAGLQLAVARRKGYLRCDLPPDLTPGERERAEVILATMALGLEDIAKDYPRSLRLTTKEV